MELDTFQLQLMIQDKYISVQKHPKSDLYIYNYTPLTQYSRYWNEITLNCRGLILDKHYNPISRPFAKFFNLEEHDLTDIPNEPFEVYTKLDGSLGILYWLEGQPRIATRGSFTSQQALMGTQILYQKYHNIFGALKPTYTYLFEIIYPENRIVVDYGDTKDLMLLAIRETATGQELSLEDIGFPLVERYDGIKDINLLKSLEQPNQEGWVIKFQSGFRIKVKFEQYVRLHKLITQISNKVVWEYLSSNQSIDKLLEELPIPDEWYGWVKKVVGELQEEYTNIERECQSVFKQFDIRKEAAAYYQQQKYPAILFHMLDGKDYSQLIWKLVKPKQYQVFKEEAEEV